jgi:hypothetical protein
MPVRKNPRNRMMVAGPSRNRQRPAAPITIKGIFETTFQKFGTPATVRQSANR